MVAGGLLWRPRRRGAGGMSLCAGLFAVRRRRHAQLVRRTVPRVAITVHKLEQWPEPQADDVITAGELALCRPPEKCEAPGRPPLTMEDLFGTGERRKVMIEKLVAVNGAEEDVDRMDTDGGSGDLTSIVYVRGSRVTFQEADVGMGDVPVPVWPAVCERGTSEEDVRSSPEVPRPSAPVPEQAAHLDGLEFVSLASPCECSASATSASTLVKSRESLSRTRRKRITFDDEQIQTDTSPSSDSQDAAYASVPECGCPNDPDDPESVCAEDQLINDPSSDYENVKEHAAEQVADPVDPTSVTTSITVHVPPTSCRLLARIATVCQADLEELAALDRRVSSAASCGSAPTSGESGLASAESETQAEDPAEDKAPSESK